MRGRISSDRESSKIGGEKYPGFVTRHKDGERIPGNT